MQARIQSQADILAEFRNNMVEFFDELIEVFPAETDIILARIMVKDVLNPEMVMNQFILDVVPHREQIKNRHEEFFLTNNFLHHLNSKGKVNHFKLLWKSNQLDDDDRKILWQWFDTFLHFAEKYQKIA